MTINVRKGSFRLAAVMAVAWSVVWATFITNQILILKQAHQAYEFYAQMDRNAALERAKFAAKHPWIQVDADSDDDHFWRKEADEVASYEVQAREAIAWGLRISFGGLALVPILVVAALWVRRGFVS